MHYHIDVMTKGSAFDKAVDGTDWTISHLRHKQLATPDPLGRPSWQTKTLLLCTFLIHAHEYLFYDISFTTSNLENLIIFAVHL